MVTILEENEHWYITVQLLVEYLEGCVRQIMRGPVLTMFRDRVEASRV